jgi:hypothetical protein
MLDVGISSTAVIARSWGLVPQRAAPAEQPRPASAHSPSRPRSFEIGAVIGKALRAAGLLERE